MNEGMKRGLIAEQPDGFNTLTLGLGTHTEQGSSPAKLGHLRGKSKGIAWHEPSSLNSSPKDFFWAAIFLI